MSAMKRVLPILLLVAACGGSSGEATTTSSAGDLGGAASSYATSALRALDGTEFEVLDARDLAEVVVGLCEGLGVGAMGVAAADLDIDAPEADVAILLEVLRTGLDQVCEERVVIDLTAIYLSTIVSAVEEADAAAAYDEIEVIRAGPVVCERLEAGDGAEAALLAVVEVLYGAAAGSIADLDIDTDQGRVTGAVLATATALLCPDRLDEIEVLVGSL
jgi:hypothetical protein